MSLHKVLGSGTMPAFNPIPKNRLYQVLVEPKGATFVTLTALTDARAKKTNNPFGKINKLTKLNCMVNFNYDEGVRRRLLAEGKDPETFQPGSSWHEPVFDQGRLTPICKHKQEGSLYLRVAILKVLEAPRYFTQDGKEIDREKIKEFLPAPSTYDNQGLEEPLRFACYKLDSIKELIINGEKI